MTKKELFEEAKKLKLVGYSQLDKPDLERFISVAKQEVIEMTREEFEDSIIKTSKVYDYKDNNSWQELRSKRIGGSDVGAIIGVNPHKSIIDVYIDKTQGSEFKGNDATYWGKTLESIVMREFAIKHNELITFEAPYSVVDSFLIANLDGVLKDKETGNFGVLEIKTTNEWNKKDWEDDVIPQSYYAQVQHYLMLTGYKFAYVAVLIGGNKYKEFRIERSEEDIELIRRKATEFMNENILKEVPPMPDGSDAYMEYLKKKALGIENNVSIELDELEEKAQRIKEIAKVKKEIEAEEKLLKEQVLNEMINHGVNKATAGTYKLSVRATRASTDKDLKAKLETENKEIISKYIELSKQWEVPNKALFVS